MSTDVYRGLVLVLLGLPLVAAPVAALLGPGRRAAVRWLAAGVTLAELVLACVLVGEAAPRLATRATDIPPEARPTFVPLYVPGDPASGTEAEQHRTTWDVLPLGPDRGPAVQFFVGVDGL